MGAQWWDANWWWSSTAAEWAGAIGTIAALGFLAWQVAHERHAADEARKQTEKSLLQTERSLQLTEAALEQQRLRDALDREERQRTQAALVWCVANATDEGIHVSAWNASPAAIFDVEVFVNNDGVWSSTTANPILPTRNDGRTFQGTVNKAVPLGQFCGFAFRDNDGLYWLKWGDGKLLRGRLSDVPQVSPKDRLIVGEDPRDDRTSTSPAAAS